ncbi:hypothetical protein LX64_00737 [Chitinophaga skermanii]|uniref:Uncharacterized protein n=1 Tax=Chitinophaga skermanii TaxID=331697 RepID=A0A327R2R6_9BACT|nr:hypothetical protein [Chitinophaga skermanii]RAJ11129.1 hypothetical protein LX64_00737 [Chitinophaga skermanii]
MGTNNLIYSSDQGLILGFHGCSEELRDAVVLGKTILRPSKNIFDWLGDGIYFWQNNYERALHYAQNAPPTLQIKKPAVLGAVFCLGDCLDLTDKKNIDLLKVSYDTFEGIANAKKITLPRNVNAPGTRYLNDKVLRKLDCAVIKHLHSQLKYAGLTPFESVRGVFFEGKEVYDGAGFYEHTHIQVCIRNPNLIKAFFIPRLETDWP